MALVRICGKHRHAVERDLIALGFNGTEDVGTPRLSLWKFAAIVLASPPDSAVFFAETRSGRYSQNDQLLANLSEQQAGLWTPAGRYDRPGAEPDPVTAPPVPDGVSQLPAMTLGGTTVRLDAFDTPEEMAAKRAEVAERIRASKKRDTRIRDKYDPFEHAKRLRAERIKAGVRQGGPEMPEHLGPELPEHITGGYSAPPLPEHIGGAA